MVILLFHSDIKLHDFHDPAYCLIVGFLTDFPSPFFEFDLVRLMLGVMLVTMFLSMWVDNTATTTMILPMVDVLVRELFRVLFFFIFFSISRVETRLKEVSLSLSFPFRTTKTEVATKR